MNNYTSRIDKIGPKHYRVTVNLGKDPETGTYKKKRQDIHGSRTEAECALQQLLYDLEQPPKKVTDQPLQEYLIHWVETIAKPRLENNTYESYRWEINKHIIPNIGHIPLSALAPLHIQTLYSYKAEAGRLKSNGGLSNRSIVYIHSILNQALKNAVDLELIIKNPCDKIKPPKSKKRQKEKMVVLSRDELKNFLKNIRDHRDYALIYTAAFTGMRISELLGLRWQDVLWDEKKINVEMTLHRLNNGEFEHRPRTKNKTSSRVVPVTDNVLAVLRDHRKLQLETTLQSHTEKPFANEWGLVFPDLKGLPQDRGSVSHRYANLVAKKGLEGMRFHDLRHTHATILLEAGEMVNSVSERLGHSDIYTTLSIYGHVLPSKAEDTANRFEQLMNT